MPTYEYECSQCGGTFEEFQSMTAEPLSVCKLCGAKKGVKRLIGRGAGMIFKGSGFYVTDYKRGGNGKSAGSGTGTGSASSEKSPAESKPGGGACACGKGNCGE